MVFHYNTFFKARHLLQSTFLEYTIFYHEVVGFHLLFKILMETRHMFIKLSVSYLAHHVHGDSLLVVELLDEEVFIIDIES